MGSRADWNLIFNESEVDSMKDSVVVRLVKTPEDLDRFIRLPWSLYKGDAQWVPPLVDQQRGFLSPKTGPFFDYGEADLWLAFRDGTPVGRLSAHVNHAYEDCQDTHTGFFGFFECIDDPEVATALFEAGAAWLRERGKTRVLGPMSFGIYDEIGLLVDGFDTMPPILLTHNPTYYAALWSQWGFQKEIDWLALRTTNRQVDPLAMQADAQALLTASRLKMSTPSPGDVMRRSDEIFKLFNSAWKANWGHVPFTRKQFSAILHELRPALRSDMIRIVENDVRIVAFIITIVDINPQLQRLNGHCHWWNQLGLLFQARWRPVKKVKTVLLGVDRRYQRRRLHDAMILDTYSQLIREQPQLEVGDCSLIVEAHKHFIQGLEQYGVQRYKTYRIYERAL